MVLLRSYFRMKPNLCIFISSPCPSPACHPGRRGPILGGRCCLRRARETESVGLKAELLSPPHSAWARLNEVGERHAHGDRRFAQVLQQRLRPRQFVDVHLLGLDSVAVLRLRPLEGLKLALVQRIAGDRGNDGRNHRRSHRRDDGRNWRLADHGWSQRDCWGGGKRRAGRGLRGWRASRWRD